MPKHLTIDYLSETSSSDPNNFLRNNLFVGADSDTTMPYNWVSFGVSFQRTTITNGMYGGYSLKITPTANLGDFSQDITTNYEMLRAQNYKNLTFIMRAKVPSTNTACRILFDYGASTDEYVVTGTDQFTDYKFTSSIPATITRMKIKIYPDKNATFDPANIIEINAAGLYVGQKAYQMTPRYIDDQGGSLFGDINLNKNKIVNKVWQNGTTAQRPATPAAYQEFFDTTFKKPVWHNGTSWIQSDGAVANSRIVGYATVAPTTGTYAQGDIYWNTTPTVGGIGHWICTTGGTPGTWTPVQVGVMSSISSVPTFVGQRAVVSGIAYVATGASAASDWVRTSEPKENGGISTLNGTGAVTAFTIAHGLGSIPTFFHVTANSVDAKGDFYVTADTANLTITYTTAPITGTGNVKLSWFARI